jgi:small subunit ribosomal protein S16
MLTIRLTRVGKKNDPSFRVIVVESKRKPQPGNYLEMVGSYDPRVDRIDLKADRIKHWLSMGATTSETVHNLLVSNKIIDAKKINVLPKKTVAKVEVPAEAPAPAPAAAVVADEPAADEPAAEVEVSQEAVVTSIETQEESSASAAPEPTPTAEEPAA